MHPKSNPWLFVFLVLGSLLLSNCSAPERQEKAFAVTEQVPTRVWSALVQMTPVPYTSALPAAESTALDGTYARFDPNPPQWWSCLRCADYRPAGGVWRLQFDRGVMRVYYEVTGWHSLASYSVSGDQLYLFNDPYCKEASGEYRWNLSDDKLVLEALQDPCSFELRGKNLSGGGWEACPDSPAAQAPRGCTDPEAETLPTLIAPGGVSLDVRQEDVRLSTPKPERIVYPNLEGFPQLETIRLVFSDTSLPYGTSRVLWKEHDWVQVTTDDSVSSMGVQFRGDYVIGWARVLFDGQEIWRGDTSRIWSELKVHGGYIEVSDFRPGEHTLRVERLDIDSRPVVVAFFGFNH